MPNTTSVIEAIVRDFTTRLSEALAADAAEKARTAIQAAFPGKSASAAQAPKADAAKATVPGRRKLTLSPEALAIRKRQGKYMGILRSLPQVSRARVKKVAQEKGVAAAIKFAATLK